jgi:hypothetical protein
VAEMPRRSSLKCNDHAERESARDDTDCVSLCELPLAQSDEPRIGDPSEFVLDECYSEPLEVFFQNPGMEEIAK